MHAAGVSAAADARLTDTIRAIHTRSRETYGMPRIYAELVENAVHVGRKRIARAARNFAATAKGQLWVADITYIPTWAGFLYLAGVLDAWSRPIVGWAMATHLRTDLGLAALNMAVTPRRPTNVLQRADQGCQYTSIAFGRPGSRHPALDGIGRRRLPQCDVRELLRDARVRTARRRRCENQAGARMAVFDFIEGWDNPDRRHSGLGQLSPRSDLRTRRAARHVVARDADAAVSDLARRTGRGPPRPL